MKKFNFPLDKILSLRTFYEKQAEVFLQRAVGERDAVKLQIEDIDVKLIETSVLFSQDVDMNILFHAESYVKSLKTRKLQLQEVLSELEQKVKEAVASYQKALKERKVLERLKDKKLEEWKVEFNKEEIFVIDEIISAKTVMQS